MYSKVAGLLRFVLLKVWFKNKEKYVYIQKTYSFNFGDFLGVPSVSLGGSFVVSLIQGKTPSEAVQIIAEQMDSIIGRVQTLETKQVETSQNIKQTNLEIERLKLENQNLKLRNDNLEKESALTSSKQSEQICQTLFADVPKIYFPVYGENYDIKANIVRYYELNKFIVDNRIDDKWSLEKE